MPAPAPAAVPHSPAPSSAGEIRSTRCSQTLDASAASPKSISSPDASATAPSPPGHSSFPDTGLPATVPPVPAAHFPHPDCKTAAQTLHLRRVDPTHRAAPHICYSFSVSPSRCAPSLPVHVDNHGALQTSFPSCPRPLTAMLASLSQL